MSSNFRVFEAKLILSDCFNSSPQGGHHFFWGNMLDSSVSPNCRDWGVIVYSRVTSDSFYYCMPNLYWTQKGMVSIFLCYRVISLILFWNSKVIDGNAVGKFALWVAVVQKNPILKKSDVPQPQNITSSFTRLENF